ncbi:unnamed protein product [Trichobilharzia szidati]|nr:unnamed protein product [Trichobilharzia szidati]
MKDLCLSERRRLMDFGNEQRISPRVYQLAQIVYREFEIMRNICGESTYGRLVPIVISILEEMDLLVLEKQKLDLDLNLLTAEKNDLSVELCRQKELYTASKRHIHCLEDELLGMKKETDKKLEELEETLRHYRLISKNANDHIFRLEEREQNLKSELSAQNERYTKLLKIYVDYIETNSLSMSNHDTESGTVCVSHKMDVKLNDGVLKSTADTRSPDDNSHRNSAESNCLLNKDVENYPNIGVELTKCGPDAKTSALLDDALKPNDRTACFIDLYQDTVDYETALESVSVVGQVDDAEDIGMMKEVEKLIKENTDLYETKNALNVLKDDLIRKLDEVTGEKALLMQEVHGIRMDRDNIKSEANRLSRLVYECRDQISSLTARLKVYEDVNEADGHSSRLSLAPIQQSKSCWTLNTVDCIEDTNYPSKHRNKSVDNLNSILPENTLTKNEGDGDASISMKKVTKFGEACFTKREMARVIAERNSYKERFLELQDAVRLAERLRGERDSRFQQVSMNNNYERCVQKSPSVSESFFSAVQSGLNELFSNFDQAVPLASVLPSEAQCYGPFPFDSHSYSQPSHQNEHTNTSGARRKNSVGLRSMFSRLFGYAVAYSTDASIGVGHDLVVGLGSQSLSDEIMSKSQQIKHHSNHQLSTKQNSISQMSDSSNSTLSTLSSPSHRDYALKSNVDGDDNDNNKNRKESSSLRTQLSTDSPPCTPTNEVIQC